MKSLILFTVMMLMIPCEGVFSRSDGKADVPDAGELKNIQRILSDEFNAKGRSDFRRRVRAARSLKSLSRQEDLSKDEKYACLEGALRLAYEVGDFRLADEMEREILGGYKLEPFEIPRVVLSDLAKKRRSKEITSALVRGYLHLAYRAVRNNESSAACEWARTAMGFCKDKDQKLNGLAQLDLLTEYAKRIETEGANAETDLIMGLYACLTRYDWFNGAFYLERCGDPWLGKVGSREQALLMIIDIREESEARSAVELGDSWLEAAKKCTLKSLRLKRSVERMIRKNMEYRAATWFERALPQLSGENDKKTMDRIKKRLKKYPDILERSRYQDSFHWRKIRDDKAILKIIEPKTGEMASAGAARGMGFAMSGVRLQVQEFVELGLGIV